MRSPLALLIICVGVLPQASLGRLVPIFIYRSTPTSSPTSTPSYQPSLRPSSRPTSQPSVSPSISILPTSIPTERERKSVVSFIRASKNEVTSHEAIAFNMLLTIAGIIVFLCFIFSLLQCARKSQDEQQIKNKRDQGPDVLAPVKSVGGMLSSFVSSMPSRIDELIDQSVMGSFSDSDESSIAGDTITLPPTLPPMKQVRAKNRSHVDQQVFSKDNPGRPQSSNGNDDKSRNQDRYDLSRRNNRRMKSDQPQQQASRDSDMRKEVLKAYFNAEEDEDESTHYRDDRSRRTRGSRRSSKKSADKRKDPSVSQLLSSHGRLTDDFGIGNAMTKTLGEALSGLNCMAENAIFPVASYEDWGSAESESVSIFSDETMSKAEVNASSSSEESSEEETVGQVIENGESTYNIIVSTLKNSAVLNPPRVTLKDKSLDRYSEVNEGDSHFALEVVAEEFEGLSSERRERIIHMLLGDTMQNVRTLEIKALSPTEHLDDLKRKKSRRK